MNFPDAERDALSDEAWSLAREIVARLSPPEWPMDDAPQSEAYLYGVLFTVLTLEATADLSGIWFRFPPLAEVGVERSRMISYETLLPFLAREVPAREAEWFAARFRRLAAICEAHQKRE